AGPRCPPRSSATRQPPGGAASAAAPAPRGRRRRSGGWSSPIEPAEGGEERVVRLAAPDGEPHVLAVFQPALARAVLDEDAIARQEVAGQGRGAPRARDLAHHVIGPRRQRPEERQAGEAALEPLPLRDDLLTGFEVRGPVLADHLQE